MIINGGGVRATVNGPEIYSSRLFKDLERTANAVIRLQEVRRIARRGTADDDPIVGSLAKIAEHLSSAIAELQRATLTVINDGEGEREAPKQPAERDSVSTGRFAINREPPTK